MNIDFKNKVILITGGTSGIGLAISKRLFDLGGAVYRTSTTKNKLIKGKNKQNFIETLQVDFSKNLSIKSFFKNIKNIKKVDILINNAGVNKVNSINLINENDWDKIYKINLKTPFLLTKDISKKMMLNKYGRILNISSIFGVIAKEGRASYSASKSGLVGLTKATALDLAPYNILVNSISPGFVLTDLTKKILTSSEINKLKKQVPLNRFADVEEIVSSILFLIHENNTYITGQNIIVDGGFTSK